MGVEFSTQKALRNVREFIGIGRKRKRDRDEEMEHVIETILRTPKRIKLRSTDEYIYRTLFEEGHNSDVTVRALEHEFKLHKVYLCQSPYFASMFGGSWLESHRKLIDIDVVDPLITIKSLTVVLGSLYDSETVINPMEAISILATATMFQMESLIEKCTEIMMDSINTKTAPEYYLAASSYGDIELRRKCHQWYLVNLMPYYFGHPLADLGAIPVALMEKLVADPDLFVVQTEYSVYVMLKYWVYLRMNRENIDSGTIPEPSITEINEFFFKRTVRLPFLLTPEGRRFCDVYKGLRLHNLVSHKLDIDLVLRDNIIPKSWFEPMVVKQWRRVLAVNQNDDKGPSDVSDDVFLSNSLRCGRVLTSKERHVWRWTGFHFGVDLLMMTDGKSVSVKRNHRTECAQLLSYQETRHVAIRVRVVRLNQQRQIELCYESGIIKMALGKGEEAQILDLENMPESSTENPTIISANILYTSEEDCEKKNEN